MSVWFPFSAAYLYLTGLFEGCFFFRLAKLSSLLISEEDALSIFICLFCPFWSRGLHQSISALFLPFYFSALSPQVFVFTLPLMHLISSVLKRGTRVCVFAQFSYRVSLTACLLQLRQPQDWEAFGRELVSVLGQDGLLLGVSHPLHVDPRRPHRLPKALCGLVITSLVVWMWPGGSLHSGPRDYHRPPIPWNTTLHYPQCLKWRIICCLLFYMLVFTLFYNVKLLIPWWWFFVLLLLFLLAPLTHKVFYGLQVWN